MTAQPARRRLFVAVWPPEDLLVALEGLERPQARGLRWTTRDQWHVTLRFLGSVGEAEVAGLTVGLGEAAAFSAVGRPVVAVAGPAPQMLGRGVWMLPVAGLDALAAAVGEAVDAAAGEAVGEAVGQAVDGSVGGAAPGAGPMPEARGRPGRFRGHLTLARARKPSLLRDLPKPPLDSSWEVQEVTLVNSTLHPAGARYDVIDRWPL
ncbi:MAG TPA: 2'-5' RNA ligase family protein [Acidimicrobiales bacterium]|nr:2'-5' RNA ligase family protein [Acidimicrobiales bacterium]